MTPEAIEKYVRDYFFRSIPLYDLAYALWRTGR